MESSIAVFLMRHSAQEQLPTRVKARAYASMNYSSLLKYTASAAAQFLLFLPSFLLLLLSFPLWGELLPTLCDVGATRKVIWASPVVTIPDQRLL